MIEKKPEQMTLLALVEHGLADLGRLFVSANEPNICRRILGPGPDGEICRTCRGLILWHRNANRRYYKCALRKNTSGAATDHRVRWLACARYEEKEG